MNSIRRDALFGGVVLSVLLFALGLPHQLPDEVAPVAVLGVFCITAGALFALSLFGKRVSTALVLVPFCGAYAAQLGDGMTRGIERYQVQVRPEHAQLAVLLLCVFLAVVAFIAHVCARWLITRRSLTATLNQVTTPWWESALNISLSLTVVLVTVEAFRSGAWTFYGSTISGTRQGGIRLELLYVPVLSASIFLTLRRVIARLRNWKGLTLSTLQAVLKLSALGVLLFMLQYRRLLVAVAFGVPVIAMTQGVFLTRILRTPARVLFGLLATGFLVSGSVWVSAAWRDSARNLITASVSERVQDTANTLSSGQTVDTDKLDRRFTYLWLDAVVIERQGELNFSLWNAAIGSAANAIPALLFPSKYDVPQETCENAFSLGPDVDLPCTPMSEGLLGGGLLGVLLVAVACGLLVGVSNYLWTVGGTLWTTLAIVLICPLFSVECGAWPMFSAFRDAGLFLVLLAAPTGFLRLWRKAVAHSALA